MKKEYLDVLSYFAVFSFLRIKMCFPYDVCKEIAEKAVFDIKVVNHE